MMLERFPPASQAKAAVGTRGVCLLGYDRNREITNHNGAIISTLCVFIHMIYVYCYTRCVFAGDKEMTNQNGAIISTLCRYIYVYIYIYMYRYVYIYIRI